MFLENLRAELILTLEPTGQARCASRYTDCPAAGVASCSVLFPRWGSPRRPSPKLLTAHSQNTQWLLLNKGGSEQPNVAPCPAPPRYRQVHKASCALVGGV